MPPLLSAARSPGGGEEPAPHPAAGITGARPLSSGGGEPPGIDARPHYGGSISGGSGELVFLGRGATRDPEMIGRDAGAHGGGGGTGSSPAAPRVARGDVPAERVYSSPPAAARTPPPPSPAAGARASQQMEGSGSGAQTSPLIRPSKGWDRAAPRESIQMRRDTEKAESQLSADSVPEEETLLYQVLYRFFLNADDTPDEKKRKVILLPPMLGAACMVAGWMVYLFTRSDNTGALRIVIGLVTLCCMAAPPAYTLVTRRLPKNVCVAAGVGLIFACIVIDLTNAGVYDNWILVVLLMDLMLICDAGRPISWTCLAVTTVWIIVKTIEDGAAYGLYDPIPYSNDEAKRGRGSRACQGGSAWGITCVAIRASVFICNYAVTRKFQNRAKREHAQVTASVRLAEDIATALVRFDLDKAELILHNTSGAQGEGVEVPLIGAFRMLLQNLQMYAPYLPRDLMIVQGDEDAFTAADGVEQSGAPRGMRGSRASFLLTPLRPSDDVDASAAPLSSQQAQVRSSDPPNSKKGDSFGREPTRSSAAASSPGRQKSSSSRDRIVPDAQLPLHDRSAEEADVMQRSIDDGEAAGLQPPRGQRASLTGDTGDPDPDPDMPGAMSPARHDADAENTTASARVARNPGAPAAGPAAVRRDPLDPSRVGAHAAERNLGVAFAAEQRRQLQNRLEAIKERKGTLLRAAFDAPADPSAAYRLSAQFAERVLDLVKREDGVVVELRAATILGAWNTHQPLPRHHLSACRTALCLEDRLRHLPLEWWGAAAATGQLWVGNIGTTWQRSTYLQGDAAQQVDWLCPLLCGAVHTRVLVTEPVYEAVRSRARGWLVDVVPRDPLSARLRGGSAGSVAVYEVRADLYDAVTPAEHEALQQYAQGWAAFRLRRFADAVRVLSQVLRRREVPALAVHATRLLLLAAAGARHASLFPSPYVRPLVGWKDVEDAARGSGPLGDDVARLLSAAHPEGRRSAGGSADAPPRHPASRAKVVSPSSPAMGGLPSHGDGNKGSVLGIQAVLGSQDGDEMKTLQREIQSEVQRHVSNQNVGHSTVKAATLRDNVHDSLGSCSTTQTGQGHRETLAQFTDRQGSVWRRSDKMLGKGSFGEVWLGMSEEGTLVAMKMLRLHISASQMRKVQTIRKQREGGNGEDGETPCAVDGMLVQSLQSDKVAAGLSPSVPQGCEAEGKFQDTAESFSTCSWTPDGAPTTPAPGETHVQDASAVLEMVEEVLKEVNLLSTLRHDNIVCYMSSAVVAGHVVICMEYVPGGSLQSVLEQFHSLTLSSIRRYTKDILRGLSFLHSKGVIHRDFKPGNVLLQVDGLCKLADFGASAALGDATGRKVVGTLLYMAPEACRGEACAASDCWAVGIAVIQMQTGRVPYDTRGLDPQSFLYRLAHGSGLPDMPDDLSEGARDFVAGCLQTELAGRPTAEELLLHAFLNE